MPPATVPATSSPRLPALGSHAQLPSPGGRGSAADADASVAVDCCSRRRALLPRPASVPYDDEDDEADDDDDVLGSPGPRGARGPRPARPAPPSPRGARRAHGAGRRPPPGGTRPRTPPPIPNEQL